METKTRNTKIFIYKKKIVNYLFFCYLFLGGFWCEANAYYPMRIVLLFVNVNIIIYGSFAAHYVWITRLRDNPSLLVILFETQTPLVLVFALPGTYILTYTLRNKLKALFKLIDDDWNCAFLQNTCKTSVDGHLDGRQRQFRKNKHRYIIVQSIGAAMNLLSRGFAAFFVPVEDLRKSYFHFSATPFSDTLDSLEEYLVIYASQVFLAAYITSLAVVLGLFVLFIAEAYLEAYILFAEYMMMNSMSLTENVEKICEKELIIYYSNNNEDVPQSESYDIHHQKQMWFKLTSEQLVEYVKCHQSICK